MGEQPSYVILGRGRWAGRMQSILVAENRLVLSIPEARRLHAETDNHYTARLAQSMRSTGAQIAWLCVLPGPHIPLLVNAGLDAGLHVVVEKPWQNPRLITETLAARARQLRRVVAIHFEYCLLSEVERWRRDFYPGTGLRFGGRFLLSRADHMGMSALENLGSHLLAIRAYAAPESIVQEVRCGYEQADQRCAWLERRNTRVAFIDLLASKERIIQRYIAKLEASTRTADFPFGLDFALRVARDTASLSGSDQSPHGNVE
ncbi:MAG TPA: hypothetical protein VJN93_09755 [Candidatus Acidoferrum sp.]|nr:hypothetical protein [Candidatus Acidoferrum sp.]